ncbi:MAG TPA: MBL fold metallo-hydrolase [Kofleriaceae bacterium]
MTLKTLSIALVSLGFAACEGPQGDPGPPGPPGIDPDAPALDKAFAGAGGRDAVTALAALRISASGERLMTLEGLVPEDDSHPISTFTAELAHDVAGQKLRIAYHREIALFGASTDFKVLVDGDRAVVDGVESVFGFPGGDLPSDRWASTLRQHALLHPELLLREIALGTRTAEDRGIALRDGELRHRIDVSDGVYPISLFVDRYTGEITDLATLENDHVAGDTVVEAHFLGWRTWGGAVRLPADVAIAVGDQLVHSERRTAIDTESALDPAQFAFPAGSNPTYVAADAERGARNGQFHEGFAGLGVPLDGLQTFVDPHQLSPGVWHLRGGSHNSLVIEQANGVVVVEAPLYEARAVAIFDWIEANLHKPVTHVVSTHHHRDHAGALRTFVARGAKVVTGEASRAYFVRAFRAPRTIEPDELSAAPRNATVIGVPPNGIFTIPDASRPVQVVPVPSTHAADLVAGYVPSGKILFISDIYSPGLPGANPAGAREVLDTVVARNLALDTVAGGHGATGTRADLEAAAGN